MTRSACLAAASALALATVLNISTAGAQSVDDTGQRALRNAPVRPVLSQSGLLRIPLLTAVQKVSLDDAGAVGSTTSQPVSGGQKLAKVEVEGDAKALKLDAGPASEQKPPVETKPNDGPVVAAAEAKADTAAEPPRAPVERQPAAEAKAEQQPVAPANAKEARAEAAPSVDRARVAVQPAQEQVPTDRAFTPRQQRNLGYGGYSDAGYGSQLIYNQKCNH